MLKIFVITLIGLMTTVWVNQEAQADGLMVVNNHDGDTLKVRPYIAEQWGAPINVRIAGIDAYELRQPGREGIIAEKARVALHKRVVGKYVILKGCKLDKYKRQACQVFENGEDVGAWMVRQGLAFDYVQYSHGQYAKEQQHAQFWRLNAWQCGDPGTMPDVFRKMERGEWGK